MRNKTGFFKVTAVGAVLAGYLLFSDPSSLTLRALAQTTGAHETMKSLHSFNHVSVSAKKPFKDVTRDFEAQLGRFELNQLQTLAEGADPKVVEKDIEQMAGPSGMMIISSIDHGALLRIAGKERHAKLYEVGNPLFALQMTKHDIRAGLYAPLRVLIYEADDGTTHIEYDKPSDLFGQRHNPAIDTVAVMLDSKLETITAAAIGG